MRRLAVFGVLLLLATAAAETAAAGGTWCGETSSKFDDETPVGVLEPLARAGDPEAMYRLGMRDLDEDRFAQGARWILAAGQAGNTDAMVMAATLYAMGWGVPRSLTSARRSLLRASDRRDAAAMLLMGASYDPALARWFGVKLRADYPRAIAWYEAAAARDCEDAARRLQYMYAEGEGVAPDKPTADRWWRRVEEIQEAKKAKEAAVAAAR